MRRKRVPEYAIRQPTEVYNHNKAVRRATPQWSDREAVERIYAEARLATEQTGILHCVDHIVPIGGRYVCGLHVEYNLQVIPWLDNLRKGNRHQ